ncbi:MAG TPA: HAD family hydrolase, partial [Candidatus Methylomirabilis sp.]|nr:HAD family hydrolase [Candidatus Methylomirabilis sp.]
AFVDRDGVLNADDGYVYRHDQIKWIPGAPEAVRLLNDRGYRVVVVTNQAGVAHGYYQESDVKSLHSWMQEELGKWGAFIDAFYYCPFHPNAKVQEYRADHPDRKPGCGLILKALSDLNIRKSGSFLIGDKDIDIIAAEKAGIAGFLFPGGNLAEFAVQCIDKFKAGAFCGAWSKATQKRELPSS